MPPKSKKTIKIKSTPTPASTHAEPKLELVDTSDSESDSEPESAIESSVAPETLNESSSESDSESDSDSDTEDEPAPPKSTSKTPSHTLSHPKTRFSDFQYKDKIMQVDINNYDNKYDKTFINAIRRIIIAELPNFSITYDDIEFQENTSMLHNKMLAQRLCLLPLKYTTFLKHENVEVTYEHTNTSEDMYEIYNGGFKATSNGESIPITEVFTSPEFLFSKLKPDQTLKFTAKVNKSTPRESGAHMMMTSTSTYWFKCDTKALDQILSSLTPTDTKAQIKDKIRKVYDSDAIEMMIDTIDEDEDHDVIRSGLEDLVYLKNDKNEPAVYTFKIKDLGALPSPQIFKHSLQVFKNKVENLITATKTEDTTKLEIFPSKTNIGSYQFDIGHEDYTLSYLMQHYFLQDSEYDYVGTIKPSPMKDMFIFRTHLKKDNTKERNISKFIENLGRISKLITEFESEFKH